MPVKTNRVAFGRINRRTDGQETLTSRSFAQDMLDLAESHRTEAVLQGHRWIASDMELRDRGDAMVGLLGFAVSDQFRSFAEDDYSWLKGATYGFTGAQEDTVVPFAVDLRDHRRWVAVATSARIQHVRFATGLAAVLNDAVSQLGLMPTDWEVDTISSRSNLLEWVASHSNIVRLRRVVKFSNPGRDLDRDRQEMRELSATVQETEFRALQGRRLHLRNNPSFDRLLEGMERGDVEIDMDAVDNGLKDRYNSRDRPDEQFVDAFDDLQAGMEAVLSALRVYSSRQAHQIGIV